MSNKSIWSLPFVILIVTNFLENMSLQMLTATLPLYVRFLGGTPTAIGVVAGAFAVSALAVRPFAGPAFDSFSRKWMLFGALALMVIATALYAVVTSVNALILIRLLHGIGLGIAGPLGLTLAADTLPSDKVSSGVSVYMLAQAISQAIGPALGIWLAEVIWFKWLFIFCSFVFGLSTLVLAFLKDPTKAPRQPYRLSLGRMFAKQAIIPAIILFFLYLAYSCQFAFVVIYGHLRGVNQIGLYFTVYSLCLLLTRPIFGRLSDRYGTTRVILPAFLCFGLSYWLLSFSTSLPAFLLASVIAACGLGVCTPLMQALMMQLLPRQMRTIGSNTTYTGMDFGMLFGPILGGAIIENRMGVLATEADAYGSMFAFMIIPVAIACIVYMLGYRRMKADKLQNENT